MTPSLKELKAAFVAASRKRDALNKRAGHAERAYWQAKTAYEKAFVKDVSAKLTKKELNALRRSFS